MVKLEARVSLIDLVKLVEEHNVDQAWLVSAEESLLRFLHEFLFHFGKQLLFESIEV